VKLWDTATHREVRALRGEVRYLRSVVFSPDGQFVAAAGGDAFLRTWDTATGQEVQSLRGHSDSYLYDVAFSRDGRTLVSAVGGHTGIVYCVAFSPDGRHLASSSWDKTIKIWDWDSLLNPAR
jgi:WD40 repeat protein